MKQLAVRTVGRFYAQTIFHSACLASLDDAVGPKGDNGQQVKSDIILENVHIVLKYYGFYLALTLILFLNFESVVLHFETRIPSKMTDIRI
jgi:hypothetical protein